jgi:hypothetical protein
MKKVEFWIQNRSKMNVSVRDLNITIPAGKSLDLMAHKFNFTLDQLEASLLRGSLFSKGKILVKIFGKPQDPIEPRRGNFAGNFNRKPNVLPADTAVFPIYDELNLSNKNPLAELLDKEAEDDEE